VDPSTSSEQNQKSKTPNSLRRVSEGLYRNPASGAYFAHFRLNGRVFKESLGTAELPVAKRKLRDLRQEKEHLDPNAGKQTLREITERHLKLQGNLSRSSITKKTGIANAVYQQWPKSIDRPALEIRASEVEEWLLIVTKGMRHSSRNEWLFFIKGVFERAVRDGILVKSPVAHIMPVKRQAVERLTPTWEQFQAMVRYIRNNTINRRCAASGDFVEFMGLSGLGTLISPEAPSGSGGRRPTPDSIFPFSRVSVRWWSGWFARKEVTQMPSSSPSRKPNTRSNPPARRSTIRTLPSGHFAGCSSRMLWRRAST
jgi:hypothetical protein